VQKIDDYLCAPGDEENIQLRIVGSENHSASDEQGVGQVVSTAVANPSMTILLEAYLVEEEGGRDDGGHDTVYEATPLDPELPWWKQRRMKVSMVIIFVLITALASSLGVKLSRPNATLSGSLLPTKSPTKPSYKCFADRKELKDAVDRFVAFDCGEAEAANANVCFDFSQLYGWPMGSWCVGDVADMSSLFEDLDMFNEDISGWSVGHVTNMSRMFFGATSFRGNVSSWDVSSVTDMREMFTGATSFNQNVCAWKDNFPYNNAIGIFVDSGCTFTSNPSSAYQGPFCASYCITASAANDCFTTRGELKAAVDQYVQKNWGTADSSKYGWPIGSWCVGNVTDMQSLFEGLDTFNEDISGWNVGQVTDMSRMFYNALSFNQDVSKWNTSSVATMESMFEGASAFDGNISFGIHVLQCFIIQPRRSV
jgi:surface protein